MKLLNFIKKYLLLIIVIIAVIVILALKFLKKKPKDLTSNANDILSNQGVNTTDAVVLNKTAKDVAHNLGTAYDWWNPKRWTENDKEVYDSVKNLTPNQFEIVSLLYHDVYAKGRTLSSDLAAMLDDEYYKELNF